MTRDDFPEHPTLAAHRTTQPSSRTRAASLALPRTTIVASVISNHPANESTLNEEAPYSQKGMAPTFRVVISVARKNWLKRELFESEKSSRQRNAQWFAAALPSAMTGTSDSLWLCFDQSPRSD